MSNRHRHHRALGDRRRPAELHRLGCRCKPTMWPIAQDQWLPGATSGAHVTHQLTCPLGDSMRALNSLGILPTLITPTRGGGR